MKDYKLLLKILAHYFLCLLCSTGAATLAGKTGGRLIAPKALAGFIAILGLIHMLMESFSLLDYIEVRRYRLLNFTTCTLMPDTEGCRIQTRDEYKANSWRCGD